MSFSQFLLKYTTINTKFIQDYANIFTDNYDTKKTIIDSEILRKWIQMSKKQYFYEVIRKKFRENIDYKLQKEDTTGKHGGHLKYKYLLTPNTAKEICMMCQSPFAGEVRKYFIAVEDALDKYKNHIINSMQQKINQLENNQKPKVDTSAGIIYVFRALNSAADQSVFKIGRTVSSKTRFSSYNSALANDLEVIMTYQCENTKQVEACIKTHMKTAQYRKFKEVYECDLDIIRKVIETCDHSISNFNKMIDKRKKIKKGRNFKKVEEGERLFMLIPDGAAKA